MPVGEVHQLARRPAEIGFGEVETGEGIAPMRVESGGDEDEIRPKRFDSRQDCGLEGLAEDVAAVARVQGSIDDRIEIPALRQSARPGIERHFVGGRVQDRRVTPEDILRTVAVMHVPVDDRDSLRPMPRVRSAWCPGGRIPTKAFATLPPITSSTAWTAPPAPLAAASKVPGDMTVSASMWTHPWRGAASRIAVT